MPVKNKTVVRVITVTDQHGDWFGHENDRHNVGELLQVLSRARPDALFLHNADGEPLERIVFDIFPPEHVLTNQTSNQMWAKMTAERLQSFGYNAVPAPEWKEG